MARAMGPQSGAKGRRSHRKPPRATPASWVGDEEKDRIRALHGRGMSLGAIAGELGRSRATISKHVAAMGLSFDREQVRVATTARVEDMKSRRARLAERLLAEAEAELDAKFTPQPDHTFTQAGEFVEAEAMPRPQDRMYLTRSATTLLAEHRHLADFDSEDAAAGAKSMLAALAAGLGAAADSLDDRER